MIEIEILTSVNCGPCEIVKRRVSEVVEKIKLEVPDIQVKLVDVLEDPDVVLKYGILSVPAVAMNGKLYFTGVPSERELIEKIRTIAR